MNGACATLCNATAKFRACHAQDVPQHPEQRNVVGNIDAFLFAIDGENCGHTCLALPSVPAGTHVAAAKGQSVRCAYYLHVWDRSARGRNDAMSKALYGSGVCTY